MSKENPLTSALKALREGSLLVRRGQLIAKDLGFGVTKGKGKGNPEIPQENVLVIGGYDLNRFAKEVFSEPDAFKDLEAPCASSRFDLLLGVPARVNCNLLWELWKDMFACESPFGDDLDKEIQEGGEVQKPYLFRIANSVEPDDDTYGVSVIELRKKRANAITLPELMIAEMFHFKSTRGGHLNLAGSTLCAGTKFKDGTTPEVRFENRKVIIDWVKSNQAEPKLGTRLVVKK